MVAPAAARERLQRVQHRLVLDRAGDQVAPAGRLERLGGAADGEVVRLGAAAGEHDLRRVGADQRRDRRSRLVERRLRLLAEVVHARRVAEQSRRARGDRVDDLRGERGRRVVVEVDTHSESFDRSIRR